MLKNVELYINNTKSKALLLSSRIKKCLVNFGYIVTYEKGNNPDLVIGLGGDGTLLKWLNNNNYNTQAKYIGVNCGTLGFLQDFEVTDVYNFVDNIPNYIEQKLNFVNIEITQNNKKSHFYALNEFNILTNTSKSLRTKVKINGELLENYVGTGLLFSTPTGSTAQNIASVGSIICPGIETIQMTPSEAIVNSKIRSLAKSICIPKEHLITLHPINDEKIKIISDGNTVFSGNYLELKISYSSSYITKLTDKKNNYIKKIREKLI